MGELLLFNGRIKVRDRDGPPSTAVLVRDGRIVAVGQDKELHTLVSADVEAINLEGQRVLPGFVDAHFHFYDWSLMRQRLQLADVGSLYELQERLAGIVQATPPGQWIQGQGWNELTWGELRLPTRNELDEVAPANPVILWRADLHLAVANSSALARAGIDMATSDPSRGVIDRDAHGRPIGLLRELAINLVSDTIPVPGEDEVVAAMKAAAPALHKLGITGLHDFRIMGGRDGPPAFRAYQRLRSEDALPLRIWMNLPGEQLEEMVELGLRTGLGDDYLRVGHVKLFADGAQGARTAWMLDPYEDTQKCGMALMPVHEIAEAAGRAQAAGLAVAIHAIGDRATRDVVSILERLPPTNRQAAPHRIEHLQFIRPPDVRRLGRLPVVASVQPRHLVDDMALMPETVGERAKYAYPFRSLLEAGVTLAFGSDCPVADPNPLLGIEAAVTRRRPDGMPSGGWYPAQQLDIAQAVEAYTVGPAIASGHADRFGTIAAGRAADLVVLEDDVFGSRVGEIHGIQVAMTIFDGQVVYSA